MKKLKSVTLALLFILTVSITMNSSQTLTLSPIVKQGSISVTKQDDTVTVKNDLVEIVISKGGSVGGVRPIKWTILETGLELAANSKPAGAIGKRYPLWDWIPNQEWPGEICLGTYDTNATDGTYTGSASISFEYTCTKTPIAGLKIIKILTFYQDKYYFDMKIILRNPTTSGIGTGAGWNPDVGYNINAIGYLEPLSDLYQGYQDGTTPYLGENKGWNRIPAKELKWIAVYNVGTGAIIAIAIPPENATNTVWLEGGRGAWGSETRVEFTSRTIAPNSEVAYVLKVYGGPPDLAQLSEVDMSNLAAGVAFSADMDSDFFVYLPNQTCKYTLNLTNKLGDDLTGVEVNVTFRESDQFEMLGKKVFDVNHWFNLTVNKKSTLPLTGDLTLTSPPVKTFWIYCLHAQTYQAGKALASLVLLIPVVSELLPTMKPLTASLVWNLHQPFLMDSPTLGVDIESPGHPSAFLTTWIQDYVEKGDKPYLLHALLLEKYPSINVTFNLQPTLLYQWNVSASERWRYWWYNTAGAYAHWEIAPLEPSEACGEALEKYRSLASSGRIELLASPYYHPIMPILVAKNWTSDLVDQIELGKNCTQEFMEVEPTGLWVPEIAFNMSLVPIINDTDLQYIVLDHRMLESAVKLPAPSFEPWYVKDPKTNKTVVAFFRARFLDPHWVDYDISNRLATEFSTSGRPSEAARQFIACLFEIWKKVRTTGGVATVALDEWVSTGGPVADKTLENIYSALQQCSYWIETKTLEGALKDVPPKQTVTNLPEGWIENVTSIAALIGEPNSTVQKMWENVTLAREMIMNYSESLSAQERATDETLKTALKYLYIAETSNWFKQPDAAIGPITGRQQANSYVDAIKQLFVPVEKTWWEKYGVYILGGSAIAVIALVAIVAYWRRKRIKAASK